MELHEAIGGRRTVHLYEPEPVAKEVLERAFEAAHQAPNHKLTFPWKFYVIGAQARVQVADINASLKTASKEDGGAAVLSDAQLESIRSKLLNPGALIAVTCVKCDDEFRSRENYAAVSCAIQNLLLSFHAQGLGSKWSTGGVTRHPATYKILGIDASREEIVGFVLAGKPAKTPSPPKKPDIDEHIQWVK